MSGSDTDRVTAERDGAIAAAHVAVTLLDDLTGRTAIILLGVFTRRDFGSELVYEWANTIAVATAEVSRLRAQLSALALSPSSGDTTANPDGGRP